MIESIHKYAKIGLIHFMAYPSTIRGEGPVEETIRKIAIDDYFDAIEITWIKDSEVRKNVRKMLDSSHLAVAPFAKPEPDPGRGDAGPETYRGITRPQLRGIYRLGARGPREPVLEFDATAQSRDGGGADQSFHLYQVDLGKLEPRRGDASLQHAVCAQNQQAFGVVVQPSGSAKARRVHEVGERAAALAVGELAEHGVGLVEQDHVGHFAGHRLDQDVVPGFKERAAMLYCRPSEDSSFILT